MVADELTMKCIEYQYSLFNLITIWNVLLRKKNFINFITNNIVLFKKNVSSETIISTNSFICLLVSCYGCTPPITQYTIYIWKG